MKNLVEEAVPESVDPVVAAGPSLDPGPAEDPEVVRVVVIHAVDQDLNPGLILAQKVGPEVERVQSPDPSRDPSPNPDHQRKDPDPDPNHVIISDRVPNHDPSLGTSDRAPNHDRNPVIISDRVPNLDPSLEISDRALNHHGIRNLDRNRARDLAQAIARQTGRERETKNQLRKMVTIKTKATMKCLTKLRDL